MSAPAGPYTVTVRRERGGDPPLPPVVLSRWAYATLEEARGAPGDAGVGARMLASNGGKVTLPDGSEIVVKATTWRDLALQAGWTHHRFIQLAASMVTHHLKDEVLAAWNAEYGIGEGA